MNTFKNMSVMVALVLGMASAYPALAVGGTLGTLSQRADAEDKYEFQCPAETRGASAKVADLKAIENVPALIEITLSKAGGGSDTKQDTDPNGDGEGGASSPLAMVKGKKGRYELFIRKAGKPAGGDDYEILNVRCHTKAGLSRPPLTMVQDEFAFFKLGDGELVIGTFMVPFDRLPGNLQIRPTVDLVDQ